MLNCIDIKFIFDSVRLDLSSSVHILQIAYVALRVVFCCFCYVLSHYFAQFQLQFLLLKRLKGRSF